LSKGGYRGGSTILGRWSGWFSRSSWTDEERRRYREENRAAHKASLESRAARGRSHEITPGDKGRKRKPEPVTASNPNAADRARLTRQAQERAKDVEVVLRAHGKERVLRVGIENPFGSNTKAERE
jgi:hypothetical protein